MKIGIITQARIGSTRLPAKILKTMNGKSVLSYHLEALKKSGLPVFVASTMEVGVSEIEKISQAHGCNFFQGSLDDVLSRFYCLATAEKLDFIIRTTSDCPLIKPEIIEGAVDKLREQNFKKTLYVSNCLERTYPRGLDFEIFSYSLLKDAHLNCLELNLREHVTPFIYKVSEITDFIHIKDSEDFSDKRITLDTPEDFEVIKSLIEMGADNMNYAQLKKLILANTKLFETNQQINQKLV